MPWLILIQNCNLAGDSIFTCDDMNTLNVMASHHFIVKIWSIFNFQIQWKKQKENGKRQAYTKQVLTCDLLEVTSKLFLGTVKLANSCHNKDTTIIKFPISEIVKDWKFLRDYCENIYSTFYLGFFGLVYK